MVDPWTGPTPVAQQFPREPIDQFHRLIDAQRNLQTQINELRNNLLSTAGVSVEPGTFRVTGNLAVDGTATVAGALTSDDFGPTTGWQLDGSTATFNVLNLRDGIVGNDALASPVIFDGNTDTLTATAPPASWGTAATANLTVPSWVTSGVVMASGFIAGATGASSAVLSGRIIIDGNVGPVATENIEASTTESRPVLHQRTFSPSGTTIPVRLEWQGTAGSGSAQLVVIGVFTR